MSEPITDSPQTGADAEDVVVAMVACLAQLFVGTGVALLTMVAVSGAPDGVLSVRTAFIALGLCSLVAGLGCPEAWANRMRYRSSTTLRLSRYAGVVGTLCALAGGFVAGSIVMVIFGALPREAGMWLDLALYPAFVIGLGAGAFMGPLAFMRAARPRLDAWSTRGVLR